MPVIVSLYLRDFYIYAERRLSPALAERPILLRGPRRILAASEEARFVGVKPGQEVRAARRLCPDAETVEFLPGRYDPFLRAALDLAAETTLRIEPLYPHEALLDYTGCRWPPRGWIDLSKRLEERGFLPLMGIASTKLAARAASLYLNATYERIPRRFLHPESETDFLGTLPLGALWRLDEASREKLSRLGLERVADVATVPAEDLVRQIGPAGAQAARWSRGIDPSRVVPLYPPLTLSADFHPEDGIDETEALHHALRKLVRRIGAELLARPEACYRIALSLDLSGERVEAQASLRSGARSEEDLFQASRRLIAKLELDAPVTGMHLRAADLRLQQTVQPDLFGFFDRKRRLNTLRETVRRRFGESGLRSMSTLPVPRRDLVLPYFLP